MSFISTFLKGKFPGMVSFFTVTFFIFLPVCLIFYALTPKKLKKYALLFFSLLYYGLVNGALLVYVLLTALLIYLLGLWLNKIFLNRASALKTAEKGDKKAIKAKYKKQAGLALALGVAAILGALITVKYSSFFAVNINTLLKKLKINASLKVPEFLMPLGISFYSLSAISYITDVYREKIQADRCLPKLILFLCFFPQIVEGPICRYEQTADELWNAKQITYKNLTNGIARILYGVMKKFVIADRLNAAVGLMFDNYTEYSGAVMLFASVCYTIQLYADFSGTMDAICGMSEIFGITMPENFRRPFFSKTVSEFWKRWHITLGEWFKDYIFFPVTMSKPMKKLTASARKKLGNHYGPLTAGAVALFCVWLCNGLWHGSAWSFIFFGMYHFTIILLGNILIPPTLFINKKLHINSNSFVYRLLQTLRTCLLVVIGEMFFRANGLKSGLAIFGKILTQFDVAALNYSLLETLNLDCLDLAVILVSMLIIFAVSLINEKGHSVRDILARQNICVRWIALLAFVFFIIIFGAYGVGYVPVDPMYANF